MPSTLRRQPAIDASLAEQPCDHDYYRAPYAGSIQTYTCSKCGDSYDRDVS